MFNTINMKPNLIIPFILLPILTFGQLTHINPTKIDSTQKEVLNVILDLFDGMREGDSSKVHSVFRENPKLHTSFTNKDGKPILKKDDLQKFLNAVGTPHDKVWDEPIWNVQINIDGNLANVWTDYAFYAGIDFSHCGVDAFMLNKDERGWKIFHLTDTRRRIDCDIPDEIKYNRE